METGLIKRRDFIRLSLLTTVSAAVAPPFFETVSAAECRQATDHIEQTLNALADTYLPQEVFTPGAVDTCALDLLMNPANGFRAFLPIVIVGLDGLSLILYHVPHFKNLDLVQRTRIVEIKERIPAERDIYTLAQTLIKLAFYGALVNDAGIGSIGFPGRSNGYPCTYAHNIDPECDESRLSDGDYI